MSACPSLSLRRLQGQGGDFDFEVASFEDSAASSRDELWKIHTATFVLNPPRASGYFTDRSDFPKSVASV
jgi:hypothetical protein